MCWHIFWVGFCFFMFIKKGSVRFLCGIRDLGFVKVSARVKGVLGGGEGGGYDDDVIRVLEQKLLDWRKVFVEKMDGMEVSLEGVKLWLIVSSPVSDDYEMIKKEWEEHFAFGSTQACI